METFRQRVIYGISERNGTVSTKERSKALILRAMATMQTGRQITAINKLINGNNLTNAASDQHRAGADAKRVIDDEATEKRVQKNDPRLKRACNILQHRCTVTSGYDGLLTIETFSTNKMIERCRKELTIQGVEHNDDFRKLGIKK
jgi:hypothetical protein